MGIYLGSRYIVDHYEHTDIVTANDVLLNRLDSAWDDPFALPERWWRQEQLADVKSGLGSIVDREFGGRALWGLKDPRLCVLLPAVAGTSQTATDRTPFHYCPAEPVRDCPVAYEARRVQH